LDNFVDFQNIDCIYEEDLILMLFVLMYL